MVLTREQLVLLNALPASALRRIREATYPTPSGKVLYDSGGDIVRLVEDLYAVCPELHTSGSSNRENDVLRQALTDLRTGRTLNDAQYGEIQALARKYRVRLKKLAASPDHEGQNYRGIVPEGTGRIVK